MTHIKKVTAHFKKADPILYKQLKKHPPLKTLTPVKPSQYFSSLTREIIGQQLSGVVAKVIFSRFQALFPKKTITPQFLLTLSNQTLRDIGLSHAKASYTKNLATHAIKYSTKLANLSSKSDEDVAEFLTEVKGIGPWTAEMFLMFTLGREDVFSPNDLGLKKAIISLYHTTPNPSAEQLEKISLPWSPYRTYASLTLWQHIDN